MSQKSDEEMQEQIDSSQKNKEPMKSSPQSESLKDSTMKGGSEVKKTESVKRGGSKSEGATVKRGGSPSKSERSAEKGGSSEKTKKPKSKKSKESKEKLRKIVAESMVGFREELERRNKVQEESYVDPNQNTFVAAEDVMDLAIDESLRQAQPLLVTTPEVRFQQ